MLDGSNNVKTTYAWGLDLSGLAGNASVSGIHGAGGIGGLLAAVETTGLHAGTYWFTYDGNGNVGQVLNATTPTAIETAAYYEYDPYGNVIHSTGTYANVNPFRFSTKWLDSELGGWNINGAVGNTGLYYYGYRYYSPQLGRWISRDPAAERGGTNLFCFIKNDGIGKTDKLGLVATCGACERDGDSWVQEVGEAQIAVSQSLEGLPLPPAAELILELAGPWISLSVLTWEPVSNMQPCGVPRQVEYGITCRRTWVVKSPCKANCGCASIWSWLTGNTKGTPYIKRGIKSGRTGYTFGYTTSFGQGASCSASKPDISGRSDLNACTDNPCWWW